MDVGLPLTPIQLVDVVLDRLVDVDRVIVDEDLGGEQVDLTEDPRPVRRRVDDDDVLRRSRPQRYLRGREVLRAPVPASVAGLSDVPRFREEGQEFVGRRRSEHLAGLERHLEDGCPEMGEQDVEVVRIDARLLR